MGFRRFDTLPGAALAATLVLLRIIPALCNVPLLFPSPVDTSGNIYHDATGNLLPVQASFADSVCAITDEEIRFGEMKPLKKCGTFVLYTELSEASFTIMELAPDGAVVRKIREPKFNVTVVESGDSGGVKVDARLLLVQKESGEVEEFTDGTNYHISNLPLNKIVRFEVTEYDKAARHVFIKRSSPAKSTPPSAKITRIENPEAQQDGFEEFHVTFSDWVVLNQPPVKDSCSHELEHRFVQRVTDGAIAINQTLLELDCPQVNRADFSEATLKKMVEVRGASDVSMSYIAPPFDVFSKGSPSIVIRAKIQNDNKLPQANATIPFSITVPNGRVVSFGGVKSRKKFVYPKPVYSEKEIQKAEDYATSVSVMAGAGVTTAVTTSVVGAVATASTGTVAGGATGGSLSGASNLLNEAQKIFLIGQIALASLPETCQALSEGLEWTMLNIKLPWEKDGDAENDSHIAVKRALFWSAVLLLGLFIAHCIMLILLIRLRIGIPAMLRLPRLELYFGYWAIPALATASAGLFKNEGDKTNKEHRNDITLGAALLVIFPGLFIALHVYTLWSFFYRCAPQKYKAIAVFENEDEDFEEEALKSRRPSGVSDIESSLIENQILAAREENVDIQTIKRETPALPEPVESSSQDAEAESGCCGCCGCCGCWNKFWETFFWTPLLGPPYSGEWMAPAGPRNLFYARFGAMFEEFRGKPMGIRGSTYGVDEQTQSVDRGIPTPIKVKRSFFSSPWEGSSIGHHLQVSGKIFDMFKLVFIATLISGEDDPQTLPQVIVILALSVVFFISLRVFRTPISRWDLGMAMFGELTDIVTFTIALIIFAADLGEEQEKTIGWIMMVTKTLAFLSKFLDHGILVIELVQGVWAAIKAKLGKNPKLLKVVTSLQIYNPRYLERKFFNRWVRNTIGKGIQTSPVKAGIAPFEEVVYFRMFHGRTAEDWKRGRSAKPESKKSKARRERILSNAKKESRIIIRNATERARRYGPTTSPPLSPVLGAIAERNTMVPSPFIEDQPKFSRVTEMNEEGEAVVRLFPAEDGDPEAIQLSLWFEPPSPIEGRVPRSMSAAAAAAIMAQVEMPETGPEMTETGQDAGPSESSSAFFSPRAESQRASLSPEPAVPREPEITTRMLGSPTPEDGGRDWEVLSDDRSRPQEGTRGGFLGGLLRRVVSYVSR